MALPGGPRRGQHLQPPVLPLLVSVLLLAVLPAYGQHKQPPGAASTPLASPPARPAGDGSKRNAMMSYRYNGTHMVAVPAEDNEHPSRLTERAKRKLAYFCKRVWPGQPRPEGTLIVVMPGNISLLVYNSTDPLSETLRTGHNWQSHTLNQIIQAMRFTPRLPEAPADRSPLFVHIGAHLGALCPALQRAVAVNQRQVALRCLHRPCSTMRCHPSKPPSGCFVDVRCMCVCLCRVHGGDGGGRVAAQPRVRV